MANGSQSSRKDKDDESINSKGRHLNGSSSTTVGSESPGTPGLRRSVRESSSKKAMPPSPASTRKSERLEKQTPTPPPVKRKSMIVEKDMPNALRRSERGKKQSASSSSGSKKSEKSSASSDAKKPKEKKETREIEESEKQNAKPVRKTTMKIKDARAYKALFMQNGPNRVNATDQGNKLDNLDKTDTENPRGGSSKKVHNNDDCSKTKRKLMEEYIQRPLGAGLEDSNSNLNETGTGMSTPSPELIHAEKAIEVEDGDGLQTCDAKDSLVASHKVASFKRKGDMDMDLEGEGGETCGTCLKRRRVDSVSTKQGPCSCKTFLDDSEVAIQEDRGRLEVAATAVGGNDSQPPVDIQTDGDQNICLVCKFGGELLCCSGRGCKQRYHLSCLDPCLEDVPLGLWHCLSCTEKRVEYGVHAISKVESIWDVKELAVSDAAGGSEKQKHFFVKYKGFSHVHNRWVLESQLLLEAPHVVAKFNQESLVAKWKQEWIVPHRLLQKRLLMPLKQHGEGHSERAGGTLVCHYEWLVKWCGLGYEDATWELENSPFLSSLEGQSLISDYESRHMKAKKDSLLSKADKRADIMGGPLTKLPHLPIGSSPRPDNTNLLDIVNKLREFLHKGQNAVIIDDQLYPDNAYDTADKWLLKENLPLSYRQQIVEFIRQNTGQKNFTVDSSFRDPFTGANAYVPGESSNKSGIYVPLKAVSTKPAFKHIPKKGMLVFDVAQFDGILKKITEFNNTLLSDPEKKGLSMAELDIARLGAIVKILKDTSRYHASKFADVDIALLLKLLKSWPLAMKFPIIDMLRVIIIHPDGASVLFKHAVDENDILMATIKEVTADPALPANLLTSIRAVTNLFKVSCYHGWLSRHRSEILDAFSSCSASTNKNVQLAYSTLLLNYAVLLIGTKDQEGQSQVLSAALEIAEEEKLDVDSKFRALVAIGSLMLEGLMKRIALDFDVVNIAKVAKASKEAKIAEVGADIELLAKQS